MVAKEKGYTEELIETKEEHITGSLLFNLVNNLSRANSILSGNNISLQDEIYFSQVKVIRELANRGACVIIGRCAEHILKEYPNCLNIFIHTDLDFRIKHLMEQDHISSEEAKNVSAAQIKHVPITINIIPKINGEIPKTIIYV